MESVLSATLEDLYIRNEVCDCIQQVLLDIETTNHLQRDLELENSRILLKKAQTEQQGVILEAHTERLERYDRRVRLADNFLVELLQINREMKELLVWKEAHEYKIKNYDTILAKLSKTEKELFEANRTGRVQGSKDREGNFIEFVNEDINGQSSSLGEVQVNKATPTPAVESMTEESSVDDTIGITSKPIVAAGIEKKEAENAQDQITTAPDSEFKVDKETEVESTQFLEDDQKISATSIQVVSIDAEANIDEPIPTILNLDMEPLMMVFGFLDAMDILNTAQINLTMYNKIDNIFGISEDGQSPPAPRPSRPPPAPSKTTNKEATSIGTLLSENMEATATRQAQKPAPGEGTPAVSKESSTSSPAVGVMGTGLFSILQPARPEVIMSSLAKTSNTGPSPAQQQPLNAKVAQSMASKLSDAELAAIISMTDKLSKLEKEVHSLRNEKEMFAGKLEGTEAVKQFLIGKVRDVEVKLQRSKDDEIKIAQQIASDQEVIAFLDSRVQELEHQTETLTLEKTGTQAGFDDLKVSSSKKITMLSDMLKYEREKLREDEGDWKATKKVLVKEVKSCRAQILALQAERDGLKEQNDMLKRAFVSTGNGGGKSSKHQNSGGRKTPSSPKM